MYMGASYSRLAASLSRPHSPDWKCPVRTSFEFTRAAAQRRRWTSWAADISRLKMSTGFLT